MPSIVSDRLKPNLQVLSVVAINEYNKYIIKAIVWKCCRLAFMPSIVSDRLKPNLQVLSVVTINEYNNKYIIKKQNNSKVNLKAPDIEVSQVIDIIKFFRLIC